MAQRRRRERRYSTKILMSKGHRDLASSRARLRRRLIGGLVIVFVLVLVLEFVELMQLPH